MLARVGPTELLVALVAVREAPGMSGKPGVFQGGHAGRAATNGAGESHYFETNAHGVGKAEFRLPLDFEAVAVGRDRIQAPRTKPILAGLTEIRNSAGLKERFGDSDHELKIADGKWKFERANDNPGGSKERGASTVQFLVSGEHVKERSGAIAEIIQGCADFTERVWLDARRALVFFAHPVPIWLRRISGVSVRCRSRGA